MGSHTILGAAVAHESTHVAGGSDDIDSALALAAMADLTSTKIWQGNAGNRPVEVALPDGDAATKEIFIPAQGVLGAGQDISGVAVAGAGARAFMRMLIPQDFISITALEVILQTLATGASMHFEIQTWYGAYNGGEAYNAHTETEVARNIGATTASEYNNHDISDLVDVAALAVGDILIVSVAYNATAIASNAYIGGLRLKYS